MLSLSPTLSFFIYTPSSIPSTLFTLYSPLYSTFNTPGYRVTRVAGLLICQPPAVYHYHYLPYSSHLYPSSLPLFPTAYTSHYSPYLSFSIYYPFLYSAPSLLPLLIILHFHLFLSLFRPKSAPNLLFNIFSITHLLTLLNSPLYIPNYLLTSFPQLTFIYSKLLTYFISSTHLYIFQITPTSLTYLILILFSISYPTLLPLLLSPLSISLSHQIFTYPYIHNPTNSFIITKNITPKILFISFLLFSIPYFQLKLHPLLLYFIFIF